MPERRLIDSIEKHRAFDGTVRSLVVPPWWKFRRSFASRRRNETYETRQRRRLCPRLSSCSGNNHKTYWSRCIYIPPRRYLQEECLAARKKGLERKNREGRWKGTDFDRTPEAARFLLDRGIPRRETSGEMRTRKSGKIIVGSRVLVMRDRPLANRSKFSILIAFIVKLHGRERNCQDNWMTLLIYASFINLYDKQPLVRSRSCKI